MTALNHVEVLMRVAQLGGIDRCVASVDGGGWFLPRHLSFLGATTQERLVNAAKAGNVYDIAPAEAHPCECNSCCFMREAAANAARIIDKEVMDQLIRENKK